MKKKGERSIFTFAYICVKKKKEEPERHTRNQSK